MSSAYETLQAELRREPKTWLVTGVAGFIGSHLLEALLKLDQTVVGLDNFSTGYGHNLADVEARVGAVAWGRFRFIEGDIRSLPDCRVACEGVDRVLHQAAIGSVPRSIDDPLTTHASNVDGFLNMLIAARDARVERFVYAASSAVYGDRPELPKQEDHIGAPLSPYAVTKRVNELYADVFARCYGLPTAGLRYFNVFGARQDPNGAYASVIPKWIAALVRQDSVRIHGDGETSRDFCYVANVVQANLLAAVTSTPGHEVYNIAVGDRTTLNELYGILRDLLVDAHPALRDARPVYGDFRPGDIRHSLADVEKARRLLGYAPTHRVREGLREAMGWYVEHLGGRRPV